MQLIAIEELPKVIEDVPLDQPMKVYRTVLEMIELCEKEHGIGLSAVQVGIPWKLFVIKSDGTCPQLGKAGTYSYFANCEYEGLLENGKTVSLEGCLSIRSSDGQLRLFQMERYNKILIKGFRLSDELVFEPIKYIVGSDTQGVVFQHEIDHELLADGLISKKGKEVFRW